MNTKWKKQDLRQTRKSRKFTYVHSIGAENICGYYIGYSKATHLRQVLLMCGVGLPVSLSEMTNIFLKKYLL